MSDRPDVLVLRRGTHGMPVTDLRDELRERLPDHDVRAATTPREERDLIAEVPIAVGMGIDEELLSHAENLDLFACAYAGTGHLPMSSLEEAGVAVTNAAGVHGPNIAEQVIGSILAFSRRFFEGRERQANHEWRHYQVGEFMGSTVTVVGLGAIGEAIVSRLEGFGVSTIGVRYTPEKGGPTDEVIGFESDDLHGALARTDVLVLACPLTDTTRGLIGEEEVVTLPEDALLVNIARGPVVETDALVSALRRNKLRGAALDVTDPEPLPEEHPLWDFGNVQITPHNAGHTPRYYERLADIVAENVERLDGGEDELRNRVV
ncbi:D-2-hydroxyacid dehydrogenase [Halalkalicoccus sp. NIPERK01]|uniref:D-2-hydroxyacid dehydrogenase n=1 Tax=Halalkalicoccus sp. NIPERK01 TaxID=3053469 RepID=UPI00256F08AF|nr:D-2-hydroxyacid dehydrogenase [Halalkalicoccus sp. NIPERK01]MDL5361424.1 D-2-hydroxyacid dehydrogenase [Halalkalicoccus sp. NIPERK01]